MNRLQTFPREIFCCIIEQLVQTIGFQKALRLRHVNRKSIATSTISILPYSQLNPFILGLFCAAIEHAICISQVIDIHDIAFVTTPTLPLRLMGRILLTRSQSTNKPGENHVSVLATLIQVLGTLVNSTDGLKDEEKRCLSEA